MNKRYYYADPIKAAYMAKNFNVRFDVKVIGGSEFVTFRPYDMSQYNYLSQVRTPFYVAKESEDIFEVGEKDKVLLRPNGYMAKCTGIIGKDMEVPMYIMYSIELQRDIGSFGKGYIQGITMRDNKQFFMPEVKNEE